ncbi:DUF2325 domain-containing protein [Lachnospiraceae bacterium ZAX-1]
METDNPLSNIQSFSVYISSNWGITPDLLSNHIFAMLSVGLAAHDTLTNMYTQDVPRFWGRSFTSSAFHHPALSRVSLGDEVRLRQVLGVVLAAESDTAIRKKVLKCLQEAFSVIYFAAKKLDVKRLSEKYASEKDFCESDEAVIDRAVFFYVSLYLCPNSVDYQLITSVARAMIAYENTLHTDPLETADTETLCAENKRAKEYFYRHNDAAMAGQVKELNAELALSTEENRHLRSELAKLQMHNADAAKRIEEIVGQQAKKFDHDLAKQNHTIEKLEAELLEEKQYHQELFRLREHLFREKPLVDDGEKPFLLEDYIKGKNIVIIGGGKQWRQKMRETYPQIYTLNGFNQNFEIDILQSANCILFFTDVLSHAVYNKVMNYIRIKQIPFGYVSSTNLEYAKREICEAVKNVRL